MTPRGPGEVRQLHAFVIDDLTREQERIAKASVESLATRFDGSLRSAVASQEWINERNETAYREMGASLSEMGSAIWDLRDAVDRGFLRLSHHLEVIEGELSAIRTLLERPLETQARELRNRAEFASTNGWLEEALKDYLEAERQNYQDFTVHQAIGNIYLEQHSHPEALAFLQKAAKYAAPHSARATARAFRSAAVTRERMGDVGGAFGDSQTAVSRDPENVQAQYALARHAAMTGHSSVALAALEVVLRRVPTVSIVAATNADFRQISAEIPALLRKLRDEQDAALGRRLDELDRVLEQATELEKAEGGGEHAGGLSSSVHSIAAMRARGSFLDTVEADRQATAALGIAYRQLSESAARRRKRMESDLKEKAGAIQSFRHDPREFWPRALTVGFLTYCAACMVVGPLIGSAYDFSPVAAGFLVFVPFILAWVAGRMIRQGSLRATRRRDEARRSALEYDRARLTAEVQSLSSLGSSSLERATKLEAPS